jgi:hypothetical protein
VELLLQSWFGGAGALPNTPYIDDGSLSVVSVFKICIQGSASLAMHMDVLYVCVVIGRVLDLPLAHACSRSNGHLCRTGSLLVQRGCTPTPL